MLVFSNYAKTCASTVHKRLSDLLLGELLSKVNDPHLPLASNPSVCITLISLCNRWEDM